MLGESPAIQRALELLRAAATGTATVLLRGESGTGKGVAARLLHELGPRAKAPFVTVDCASLPANLLESELFGHEKGAFTGATAQKPGRVELAHGGTLFLDEIGEVPPPLQSKLLRLVQDREFDRLGGTRTLHADVRIVAATHQNLEQMIQSGQFRGDLFYRLNVVSVSLPPLRARRSDIDALVLHFAEELAKEHGKPPLRVGPEPLRVLRAQRWPGNVRQLRNFIERLVVLSRNDEIDEQSVLAALAAEAGESFATEPVSAASVHLGAVVGEPAPAPDVKPLDQEILAAERSALLRALEAAKGNRTVAARMLGVSRSTFYAKLAEHGIE